MLDVDLADLYGVTTGRLNEQVKRNMERFPDDFMFQLSREEAESLRSQSAISKTGHGGRLYAPFALTEHVAIMAASVLNSLRAIEASVWVVRAFVTFREALVTNRLVLKKLAELEGKVGAHDAKLQVIIKALKSLMAPSPGKKGPIGVQAREAPANCRDGGPTPGETAAKVPLNSAVERISAHSHVFLVPRLSRPAEATELGTLDGGRELPPVPE